MSSGNKERDLHIPLKILDADTPRLGELASMVGKDRQLAERLMKIELARGAPGKAAAVLWAIERLERERR